MAKTAVLALAAALTPGILAAAPEPAHDLTVEQFSKLLLSMQKESDAKAARHLAGLRLSERASVNDLKRWEEEVQGSRAREALLALVDASAMQRPPALEILGSAPAGAPGAKEIIARAMEFAKETLPRLPNFYALRSTTSFAVATEAQLDPSGLMAGSLKAEKPRKSSYHALGAAGLNGSADQNLYWTGSFAHTVTYRDGAEVDDAQGGSAAQNGHMAIAMTTWGEFGPILRVVLQDAPEDKIVLDRWENSSHGVLAVFRYSVPSDRSHVGMQLTSEKQTEFPAYDGEFAVEPATGTIYRITIRTAESGMGFVARSFVMVEFGPTQIGGVDYVCPVRGVAISGYFDPFANEDAQPPPLPYTTSINDVTFTGYHVFRTNARIVP